MATQGKRIGGTLLLCLFLLPLSASAESALALGRMLAEEGDWDACRRECRRLELAGGAADRATGLRQEAVVTRVHREDKTPVLKWLGALPVRAMVGFYRVLVAPAIGSRCVLKPSCSRYSMQAARERGWIGIPMTGDRLIREPSVVMAKAVPVEDDGGRIRYADPVSDHIGGGDRSLRW